MADERISLSDMIAQLRNELAKAKAQGQNHDLKLQVEEAEIELQVAITREGGGGGSVKFWVANVEAKGKLADAVTQKIKLKLKALDADDSNLKIRAKQ